MTRKRLLLIFLACLECVLAQEGREMVQAKKIEIIIPSGLSIGRNVLWVTVRDFTFKGSPIGLVQKLHDDIDPRIYYSRITTPNAGNMDNRSALNIDGFSGTILELLISVFPEQYNQPIWQAEITKGGGVEIRFGGPLLSTPKLETYDPIKFIPPGSSEKL